MGKQLTSKQIYELREMLRITKTRKSRFDENATLENVVEDKVQYIIDNEIYKPPYISCFTVQQLLWGGVHWKGAAYKIKVGVLEHAGIQRPPNWYFAEQGRRFGYIMDWPPLALRNVITQTMRNSFINPLLDGDIETPYRIGWCKGYIEEMAANNIKKSGTIGTNITPDEVAEMVSEVMEERALSERKAARVVADETGKAESNVRRTHQRKKKKQGPTIQEQFDELCDVLYTVIRASRDVGWRDLPRSDVMLAAVNISNLVD